MRGSRARANGVKLGRPTVAPKIEQRVRELRAQGMGLIKIGPRSASTLAPFSELLAVRDCGPRYA